MFIVLNAESSYYKDIEGNNISLLIVLLLLCFAVPVRSELKVF